MLRPAVQDAAARIMILEQTVQNLRTDVERLLRRLSEVEQRADYTNAGVADSVSATNVPTIRGTLASGVIADGTANCNLTGGGSLQVYNFLGDTIASGKKIVASLDHLGVYTIHAARCS